MKFINLFLIATLLFLFACSNSKRPIEQKEWGKFYNEQSLNGTFVLKNLESGEVLVHNPLRADTMFTPASTFKIFNSLVSLQEEVIDETTVVKWDSVVRSIEAWNEDMWMTKAFPRSCVWYYQELARRVGEERMQYWLDEIGYGNQIMGAAIDLFWLEGDLIISANQQIELLEDFYRHELTFDKEIQARVKELMIADSTSNYKVYAKTGWGMRIQKQVAWYVGIVETVQGKWVFANNFDVRSTKDLRFRKELLYKILKEEEIIP